MKLLRQNASRNRRSTIWALPLAGILMGVVTGCGPTHLMTNKTSNALGARFDALKPVTDVPGPTDSIRKQYYSSWPKSIQEAVDHHALVIGMDKLQVQVALGILANKLVKEVSADASGTNETWYVWHNPGWWSPGKPGDTEVAIIFQGDKLVKFHRVR